MKFLLERHMNQSNAQAKPGSIGHRRNLHLRRHSRVMSTPRKDGERFRTGQMLFRRRVEDVMPSVELLSPSLDLIRRHEMQSFSHTLRGTKTAISTIVTYRDCGDPRSKSGGSLVTLGHCERGIRNGRVAQREWTGQNSRESLGEMCWDLRRLRNAGATL
jgi:hypothetical protein